MSDPIKAALAEANHLRAIARRLQELAQRDMERAEEFLADADKIERAARDGRDG
jgi:hypothetical protein